MKKIAIILITISLIFMSCFFARSQNLTEKQRSFLKKHHFVITPSESDNFSGVFEANRENNIPSFITVDSALHYAHKSADLSLRYLEYTFLRRELNTLTSNLVKKAKTDYKKALSGENETLKKSAALQLKYAAVGYMLLNDDTVTDIPEKLLAEIKSEIKQIENASGFSESPLFDESEDYSQYKVRGHYTRNEKLGSYFRASMWFGRRNFLLKKDVQTLSSLMLVRNMLSDENLLKHYHNIDKMITFFAGETDDLNLSNYKKPFKKIYGKNPSLDALAKKIDKFRKLAKKLKPPKILSTLVKDTKEKPVESQKGFRLLGQRSIPDSVMFQNLVYNKVGTRNNPRLMPSALDIMTILGSREAEKLTKESGFHEFKNYREQLNKLKENIDITGGDNLYNLWMSIYRSLLNEKSPGFDFTKSDPWDKKLLLSSLGSWTQLRHDTILYAKQSYTVGITSAAPQPEFTKGFVEPYPETFRQLSTLISRLKSIHKMKDDPSDQWLNKLKSLKELFSQLSEIASQETNKKKLDEDDYRLIWNCGKKYKKLTSLPKPYSSKLTGGADSKSPLIADVHTDPNSKQVLEEGVGYPFEIIVKIDGKYYRGPLFSYYEFTQEMDSRLSDEEWIKKLDSGKTQKTLMPEWVKTLIQE